MSLFLNNDTISIRRGDSGVIRLVFDRESMSGVYVTFAVKTSRDEPDENAVISKSYQCGVDPTVQPNEAYFFLKPEDTNELEVFPEKDKNDFQEYVWMVKIETNNGMLADTVIPSSTNSFPKFRVYYGSVPDDDMDNTFGIIS